MAGGSRLKGKAAGERGRRRLRSRERLPRGQENNHKHDTEAHDFLPAVVRTPQRNGLSIDYVIPWADYRPPPLGL